MQPLPTKVKVNGKGDTVFYCLHPLNDFQMDKSVSGVATQTSHDTEYYVTPEFFQYMTAVMARLGSINFVKWMRKEGLI